MSKAYEEHKKELIKIMTHLGCKYSTYKVFEDFITLLGYDISNAIDYVHREERQKKYIQIFEKYSDEEKQEFIKMTAILVEAMEIGLYQDFFGEIYHQMNLHNEDNGQFFTPMSICNLMSDITIESAIKDIKEKGYCTVLEPTCGSGAMLLGAANTLHKKGFNPSTQMCCLAVDNDFRCCMMAYIQLSLLGIPAVVVHGDSLLVKEYQRFYTPTYVLNGWVWREQMSMTTARSIDDEKLKCMLEPMYALIKQSLNLERKDKNEEIESVLA